MAHLQFPVGGHDLPVRQPAAPQARPPLRGYKEKGNINTPLKLAILNQTDRFTLVIDVIDRVPGLAARAAHLKDQMRNEIIRNLAYAHGHGTDRNEIANWVWPLQAVN